MAESEPTPGQRPLEVLRSRRVYDGKLFQVDVENVRLPGAVALVVVDPDGKLLLVRQYRRPVDRQLLKIPAGTREAGEDAETCARRETQEETGYQAAHVERLGGFYSAPGFCTELLDCYLCTDLSDSDLRPEEDEDLSLERMSVA